MINSLNNDSTIQDLKDAIVVDNLKELLYDLQSDSWFDDPDELGDACRLLIEYFGTPNEDYMP